MVLYNFSSNDDHIGCLGVVCFPRMWEVVGWMLGQVIPKTLKFDSPTLSAIHAVLRA